MRWISKILNDLSDKHLNLSNSTDIFNNLTDLYKNIADNSIDIEVVYENANNHLKKIELESPDEGQDFAIVFTFSENDYFTNE